MRVVNIGILVLAIVAIGITLSLFKRDRSSIRRTIFWLGVWSVIGLLGSFPQIIDTLMYSTMMRNRMYFLFVVAFLILYGMEFHRSAEIELQQRHIKRLAQEISLLRHQVEYGIGVIGNHQLKPMSDSEDELQDYSDPVTKTDI
jgi:hypothetical protein